jgi:hypothetical protein
MRVNLRYGREDQKRDAIQEKGRKKNLSGQTKTMKVSSGFLLEMTSQESTCDTYGVLERRVCIILL